MNPKIAKLRAELEKNTERITRLQARNGELKQQIQELESVPFSPTRLSPLWTPQWKP